jgi:hypothetical protein
MSGENGVVALPLIFQRVFFISSNLRTTYAGLSEFGEFVIDVVQPLTAFTHNSFADHRH